MNKYFCFILGEDREEFRGWHSSTLARAKAYAISIHLPLLIWLVIGYLLSVRIFGLSDQAGLIVSAICGITIFLIERLVITAPKSIAVTIGRLVIALVVGIIGSVGFDLVIFDKEVNEQLKVSANQELSDRYKILIDNQVAEVEERRNQWKLAEEKAQCEANGTCGSGVRSIGPLYREAKRHADVLREDLQRAEQQLQTIKANFAVESSSLETDGTISSSAGLLARIKALHQYVFTDAVTIAAWVMLFLLVTCIELMVVFVKLAFGETVDDQIARLKAQVRIHKANRYASAVMSPYAEANELMNSIHHG
uniref:DUF4407 domain-containing protein n=1 Tax=Orrella sp. TaxID=1921583 RepID=UPI004047B4A4